MDLWVRLDRNYQIKMTKIVLIDRVFFKKKQFNCYVVKKEKEKSQIIPPAA